MRDKSPGDCASPAWLASATDPVRDELAGATPDLGQLLELYPQPIGEPAFDPTLIRANAERLETRPAVDTGHPFLDVSVKTALAHVDATFQGDHPKYGVADYAQTPHDTFPPVIISTVDALSAWGLTARAERLFTHWLGNFVGDDGRIAYYGPSVSEYGKLLHTAALLAERAGAGDWWSACFGPLDRIAERMLGQCAEAAGGLIAGSPEADERKAVGAYLHNNAWVAKGLRRWAGLCERAGASPVTPPSRYVAAAEALAADTLRAIEETWPEDPDDWWLPPMTEPVERPDSLTATRLASYTNYRYWPELLSSGLLPPEKAHRVVEARLSAGGQFCGMTRFRDWLDDWPLTDYLYGLWSLGRRDDFLLSLYGHVVLHQAKDHLTAYEQVTFPPGGEKAAYCLPCQLVAARAARLLQPAARPRL